MGLFILGSLLKGIAVVLLFTAVFLGGLICTDLEQYLENKQLDGLNPKND